MQQEAMQHEATDSSWRWIEERTEFLVTVPDFVFEALRDEIRRFDSAVVQIDTADPDGTYLRAVVT